MNKIREIMDKKDSVLFFDIDGVLALMEWGEHTHFGLTDEEWKKYYEKNNNLYGKECVIKRFQEYLKDRDMSRIYVITKAYSENEWEDKKNYAFKYYNIPKENVYYVDKNVDKVKVMLKVREQYPNLEEYKFVMIDDSVDVLTEIMNTTNFSTAHVSSFVDM